MKTTIVLISLLTLFAQSASAISGFVETFDGNGAFASVDGNVTGLDNPDFQIFGDGELRDGGYFAANNPDWPDVVESDMIHRELFGSGSFFHRVEIRGLKFSQSDDPLAADLPGISSAFIEHKLDRKGASFLVFSVSQLLSSRDGKWRLAMKAGGRTLFAAVDSGSHIALEVLFDQELSKVSFGYDNDVNDDVPSVLFFRNYEQTVGDIQFARVQFDASDFKMTEGILDYWSLTDLDTNDGDFNSNGILDVSDIDLLSAEILAGTHNLDFDVIDDNIIDESDRNHWVHSLANTYFGDSNLDGEFNSKDLVAVFQANEYEDDMEGNSTWATGDWNGDGDFNSRDLVVAFADGGYEMGPRAAVRSVPEPSGVLLVFAMICLIQTSKISIRRVVKDSR